MRIDIRSGSLFKQAFRELLPRTTSLKSCGLIHGLLKRAYLAAYTE